MEASSAQSQLGDQLWEGFGDILRDQRSLRVFILHNHHSDGIAAGIRGKDGGLAVPSPNGEFALGNDLA